MKATLRIILLMLFPLAAIAVPNYVNYQGRLLDSAGIPVGYPSSVNMSMVVTLWNDPTATLATNELYQETQSTVNVNDGVYAFQIGSGTPTSGYSWIPAALFNGSSPVYVEIKVQGNTLTPRLQLLSAPFSVQAGNSDNLGGNGPGYYATGSQFTTLQGQYNSLLLGVEDMCNNSASGATKWSVDNNTCFGNTPSNCYKGNFTNESFPGITLNNANCVRAQFANTNFTGSTFTGTTTFANADFTNANMTSVNFSGRTTLLNATGLKTAIGLATATWVAGIVCPNGYVVKSNTDNCLNSLL